MAKAILGISAFYHDSAAALVVDGEVVASAQEERFTRIKHDPAFPKNAIQSCLSSQNIKINDLSAVVFYDKPLLKFDRLLETYLAFAPKGFRSFIQAMPIWLKEKLFLKELLKRHIRELSGSTKNLPNLLFTEHHQAHAASAFYPSPFERAGVLCLDGVGEWATSSIWLGENNTLRAQWEIDFPHSLGLLYSAFTYFTGFKVNSGEYKLMGLAPYGQPKYVDLIFQHLIDVKEDGTFRLNLDYFNYPTGLTMTSSKLDYLFGGPARSPETDITQREMDLARSIQVVTEEVVKRLARTVRKELDVKHLTMAGGVALNCVANGKLQKEKIFDSIWVQPAAGDAGGALGAALCAWHDYFGKPRTPKKQDSMQGSFLGPRYAKDSIAQSLKKLNAPYTQIQDGTLYQHVAALLAEDNVIGWFQGRMEFGPRALGGRSIIGNPMSPKMQSVMNLKIKYRESFRPFAPAIRFDRVQAWFDCDYESPYMLMVADVLNEHRMRLNASQEDLFGIDKLNVVRSKIPAVTHVDYSARIQTVHPDTNPAFYALLCAFEELTGCPILINTSFNVRGEPIVCTPEDAYRCFMRTEMDYLILENVILNKKVQPQWAESHDWQTEFALD